jgi:hypothetical protein
MGWYEDGGKIMPVVITDHPYELGKFHLGQLKLFSNQYLKKGLFVLVRG